MSKTPAGPDNSGRLPSRKEVDAPLLHPAARWAGVLVLAMIVPCLVFEALREILF